MKKLLRFLNQYRNGGLWLVLELCSLYLVLSNRNALFANKIHNAHHWVGQLFSYIEDFKKYSSIKQAYQEVLHENSFLRAQLMKQEVGSPKPLNNIAKTYHFIPAKVVNNSIIYAKNYLTIDKGAQDGITPGMGVIHSSGIVGCVRAVSDHFSTITSLLHMDMLVSVKVGTMGVIATVSWSGDNFRQAQLLYVPRHIIINPGDTVVTSGYNATFYEGVLIGQVKQVKLQKEALFYTITVDLSTDFSTLQHVYVIKNKSTQEKDSLEKFTRRYDE